MHGGKNTTALRSCRRLRDVLATQADARCRNQLSFRRRGADRPAARKVFDSALVILQTAAKKLPTVLLQLRAPSRRPAASRSRAPTAPPAAAPSSPTSSPAPATPPTPPATPAPRTPAAP